MLEEEDRKEIIKLQEATHTSVIAFVLSLFIPLVGLILGLKAKGEIDKSDHTKSGSAFAVAAIWIGAIGTLIWAAIVALVILVSVGGGSHDGWHFGGLNRTTHMRMHPGFANGFGNGNGFGNQFGNGNGFGGGNGNLGGPGSTSTTPTTPAPSTKG